VILIGVAHPVKSMKNVRNVTNMKNKEKLLVMMSKELSILFPIQVGQKKQVFLITSNK
jgi:hypothetical protein